MTKDNVLCYLDKCRKPETEDPLHKWIGSYNIKFITLSRFFKWLHYPDIDNPKRRSELSLLEKKPDCIIGIRQLKRKEISCYKPSDLWSQQDDLLFLKWVTNKRDRCYHTMSRDLTARPHEILNLKIKDIVFKAVGDGSKQYAEVLVNGKTGTRHIPLIQSIPYIKDWLSNHPSRNKPNSTLFIGLSKNSMGKQLGVGSIYQIYRLYKEEFFPKLLEDPTVTNEEKEKIKSLLAKPFNPYVRRHSALTEKSTKLKSNTLNQHAGWSMNSHMAQKYVHYFGNESSESLLEAYGIVTNNKIIDTLNPKVCPNCSEGNTQDSKFCSKCKMIMSYDDYQEVLESEKKEKDELKTIKEQFSNLAALHSLNHNPMSKSACGQSVRINAKLQIKGNKYHRIRTLQVRLKSSTVNKKQDVEQIKQEIAEIEKYDSQYEMLRRLPLYCTKGNGYRFVSTKQIDTQADSQIRTSIITIIRIR
jgi:integrase/recombinase XerD